MIETEYMSNYKKYRGKCKELSEAAVAEDPTLTLVRGWYWCPISNKQEMHWWTKRSDGSIYDPSKAQFMSNGLGEYSEFSGYYTCEQCGKKVAEEDVIPLGNYVVCSDMCARRLVGV